MTLVVERWRLCQRVVERKGKEAAKKKVLQEKSQHAYNLNLKTAMKALDDNIEKGKPEIDSASNTENASETENVSMDTNSDHDYSPPVSGTQKKNCP